MGKHHKHKKSSDKWTKITANPKDTYTSASSSPKVHKKKKHKGGFGKLNKIGKGIVKRTDSVGKFTGGIIKQQSSAIAGITKTLSNPLVMIALGGVVLFILIKK